MGGVVVKSAILLFSLFVFSNFAIAPQAQQADPTRTGGVSNGRFWKVLGDDAKFVWLTAYHDGLTNGLAASRAAEGKDINIRIAVWFPSSLTWADTRAAVDQFYLVPENAPIPLNGALKIICSKSRGADKVAIEQETAEWRKIAHDFLQTKKVD
jgi:hypothetical protein